MPGTNVAAETSQDWKQALSRAAIGHCVIVILEERSEDEYAEIKCMGDLESGRHVLCMLREKFEKGVFPKEPALGTSPHLQYLSNIVMKLNIKAGGINHRVKLYQKVGSDTIVMGADVTHPGVGQCAGFPSIACVVGSIDKDCMNYLGSMRLQAGRQEVSDFDCP